MVAVLGERRAVPPRAALLLLPPELNELGPAAFLGFSVLGGIGSGAVSRAAGLVGASLLFTGEEDLDRW